MKKRLILLVLSSIFLMDVYAAPNVNVYGVIDTGYLKETRKKLKMDENVNSRIGFRGVENLNSNLKAIFEIEKRLNTFDGENNSNENRDLEGAAYIGLADKRWGKVRFGRVPELTYEYFSAMDPFEQGTIGASVSMTNRTDIEQLDNTVRYDSLKWDGFSFGLSYSLGKDTRNHIFYRDINIENDGFGINFSYENGPFKTTTSWARIVDSADSDIWNVGVTYKFEKVQLSLLYEKVDDKGFLGDSLNTNDIDHNMTFNIESHSIVVPVNVKNEQTVWLLGMTWDMEPGQMDFSIQRGSIKDIRVAGDVPRIAVHNEKLSGGGNIMKYAVGYTYYLSKQVSLYSQLSFTKSEKEAIGLEADSENETAFQFGMTYRF